MTTSDPELIQLLIQELERHLTTLDAVPRDAVEARRSVHALRGSAGLSGERDLAAALERLHRRIREGDECALDAAANVVRTSADRLRAGKSAMPTQWPHPPADLTARPVEALVRAQYAAEMRDRLAGIDDALSATGDPVEAVRVLFRHVHTMKGAASAAGDEPMTWFCHGLEERVRGADSTATARDAMSEVARWRVLLGALLDEPETALAMLGAQTEPSEAGRGPSEAANHERPSPMARTDVSRPLSVEDETTTIRVRAADVDRLIDGLDVIHRARERIGSRAQRGRELASTLREMRASLVEALRAIGPARPWGAPASALEQIALTAARLGPLSDELNVASTRLGTSDQALRDGVVEAKKQLSAMRQTTVGRIFARLTTAIESEARRSGCAVIVRTAGADEIVDRHVGERLVEPCLQLVRNAVAHGIEPPEVRAMLGKPPSGTITLRATRVGHRLRITIADDGAGVDIASVRERAVRADLVTPAIAEAADDDTLLSLLFMPGFSTRESSDLLAGRGIGLDITRAWLLRLGGVIRLSSHAGQGFTAEVDVPMETGFVTVMWIRAGDNEFALPASNALQVTPSAQLPHRAPHLLACLDAGPDVSAPYAVNIGTPSERPSLDAPAWVGIDGVGLMENLLIRPLGPLIAGLGPFAGAIVRGDGSLRIALDGWAMAPRARAMAAAHPASSGGRVLRR